MYLSYLLITGILPLVSGIPTCPFGLPCSFKLPTSLSDLTLKLKPNHFTWQPAGPGDVRSPCPMLNALANHGFLPHDGRHITLDILKKALNDAANIGEDVATGAFTPGLTTNPTPNADFIDLDMLNKHNVIEHDGSLSRRDEYFNPTNPFDEGTFDQFLSYFGGTQTLDVPSIANARARHVSEMSKINPTFGVDKSALGRMAGESAFILTVLGSPDQPVAKRSYVEYFFRNERLPVLLGWTPNDTTLTLATLLQIAQDVIANSPADVPLTF
ncbi:hypothetical protein CkaCkLH20_10134 [Colletotrichum karsti]|uniref:Heme haloperoxidase family profile domain-containing protein n=1 Tax=Colletotrichum karsti TaxID=1095194 RepID=A0A9P6HW48_9PEZI|nr:uncharacterized protein CkaCkLH20_10134 [Colletotrichum karsti]KAF9872307.1 hypothetical protein CkaCkLH20_10134 [Colletotrichum karsti]